MLGMLLSESRYVIVKETIFSCLLLDVIEAEEHKNFPVLAFLEMIDTSVLALVD